MEIYKGNSEFPTIHKYKGVLPPIFKSIGLETRISPKFEWLNAEILFKDKHFLTLEAIPGYFDSKGVYINYRFNSPIFKGLEKIEDQVAEMSEFLNAAYVVHVVAKSEENLKQYSGYGIVIPFADKERNISKVINLVWATPKPNSDIEQNSWELRRGDWAHTSTFLMKAMGINPQITLG